MRTFSAKPSDIEKKWWLIDADGLVLGRLATIVAKYLRGKHKTTFTPHMDCGDNIVVINAEKVKLTGSKRTAKTYYWHTGHPGGIKEITPEKLHKKKPGEVLKLAVKRMLPGGPLAKKQLTKLKIYNGENHPHDIQKPKVVDFKKLNKRNLVKS